MKSMADGFRYADTSMRASRWIVVSQSGASIVLLNPFAPHITEELYTVLANNFPDKCDSSELSVSTWPNYDEKHLIEDEIEIVVQVNGKLRDKTTINKDASEQDIKDQCQNLEKIKPFIDGLTIRKIIVVPGKLVNLVAN